MRSSMIIGTVASARDLPVAIRMAQSVKQHMPSSKVVCGVMEASMPSEAFHCPYFDEVILMQDTGAFADMQKFFSNIQSKKQLKLASRY